MQPTTVTIPTAADTGRLNAALFTRITVFESYRLADYESEITLPLKCHEIATLTAGARYRISYQLGSYPRFNVKQLDG